MTPDTTDYPAHEQARQQQQAHLIAAEIAQDVESRLIAKAAAFLLLNAAALIASIATGIGAYYSLDKRITTSERFIEINSARIERLINEDIATRQQTHNNQTEVMNSINDVRRLFYEHDRALNYKRDR